MISIQLIHWNISEAQERAERLEKAGYEVAFELGPLPALLKELKANPPEAVVIDLSRLPSQGRDVGIALRSFGRTQRVPLVFVGGDPKKAALVRQKLPDAVYTAWEGIETALAQAIAAPPQQPVAMKSQLDGYSGKPLATKLGIKARMAVALVNEPDGFRETLGELPEGVDLFSEQESTGQLVIWFVRSLSELLEGMEKMALRVGSGSLWVAWPKKGSSLAADVGEQAVRESGLAVGLVDFKICAIDATWSGLLFRRRKVVKGSNT
ncbi:MAG TPA: hypothetical protein VF313_13215 [Anaerolineaceae bacterium]